MPTPPPPAQPGRLLEKWVWIGGWALPPGDLGTLVQTLHPGATHHVFPPTVRALDEALRLRPDVLAGYSLGALLVLARPIPDPVVTILAVAPIFAFDAETGRGGLTPARSRLALAARFKKDPLTAIKLYLRLAGMGDCCHATLPYAESDLAWGLEALGHLRADPGTIARARLYAGQADPLTNAKALVEAGPALEVLDGCGHDYRQLLPPMFDALRHAGL